MNTVNSVVCLVVFIAFPFLSTALQKKMHGEGGKHDASEVSPSDLFSGLDVNSDGLVTKQEHNNAAPAADLGLSLAQQQYVMQKYDLDKSGHLSDDEKTNLFNKLDDDGDGLLTLEELSRKMLA